MSTARTRAIFLKEIFPDAKLLLPAQLRMIEALATAGS